jgi:hypothetical protein
MTDQTTAQRMGRLLPILMSMLCLGLVIEGFLEFRLVPQKDGGWQAHIFQLLMTLQLPIILMYGIISRRQFRQSLPVIFLQTGLWLAAVILAKVLVD